MQTGAKYGMQLLNDALEKLVMDDKVEPAEAVDRAIDKEELIERFKKAGIRV